MFRHIEHHPDECSDDDETDEDKDENATENENGEVLYIHSVQIKDLEPCLRKVEEAMEKVNLTSC